MKALVVVIICGLLAWITQIVLVVLKLAGHLDWPWILILLPLASVIAAYGLKRIAEEDD